MTNTYLEFDSKFESGNLATAIYVSPQEYDLTLQNDTNTRGYTQWFYFKVRSSPDEECTCFKFNLLNHTKSDSLFNYGKKILMS